MIRDQILEAQELFRANAIVAKARKEGTNVAKTLRDHMVGRKIIESILGDSPDEVEVVKKKRGNSEAVIIEWAKSNIGRDTNPAEIANATDLSYATANKVVGLRTDWFQRIKKGHYIIRDADSERQADKAGT